MTPPAIECENVRRVYRHRRLRRTEETVALDGLSLVIEPGTVFGLLGPNGAGKTTTVWILSTLLLPTSGRASVLGFDVERDAPAVRRRIGVATGGERGFYGRLTGWENLEYYASLSGLRPRQARVRIGELLERLRLTDKADVRVEQYSRGMKQRLHLGRALLSDPPVLFLDEPSLGLDPVMAEHFRALIPELAAREKTILITTNDMREADLLCHKVMIINSGKAIVEGRPAQIKAMLGTEMVFEATLRHLSPGLVSALRTLGGVSDVETTAHGAFHRLRVYLKDGADVQRSIAEMIAADVVDTAVVRSRTLEEAYLAIARSNAFALD